MTEHRSHRMHRNSLATYDAMDLGDRERLVLGAIATSSVPLTDREVMERLGFTDMNAVRPSITRLKDRGKLIECGDVKDRVTGRPVRTTRIAEPVQLGITA